MSQSTMCTELLTYKRIDLFHSPTLMHNSFYSLTMLHYNPRHVSSSQSALIRHPVQPFTESDDTRCCVNTIYPPEDGHVVVRNMSRIVM
jgi:hypothetical protein